MDKTVYTALILGSTGLIGDILMHNLLASNCYSKIYAISRRPLGFEHPKMVNIVADYYSIDDYIKDLKVDHFYSCIGSTKSKTPERDIYYQIDHDYPYKVSKYLINNNLTNICIVSSIGANSKSKNFYLKMKGDLERDIIKLAIPNTFILRPSLLLGKRGEKRLLESISSFVMSVLNVFLLGRLKDYRSIKAEDVASTMQKITTSQRKGLHIIQTEKIKELA